MKTVIFTPNTIVYWTVSCQTVLYELCGPKLLTSQCQTIGKARPPSMHTNSISPKTLAWGSQKSNWHTCGVTKSIEIGTYHTFNTTTTWCFFFFMKRTLSVLKSVPGGGLIYKTEVSFCIKFIPLMRLADYYRFPCGLLFFHNIIE
jgi:hypothetical protein